MFLRCHISARISQHFKQNTKKVIGMFVIPKSLPDIRIGVHKFIGQKPKRFNFQMFSGSSHDQITQSENSNSGMF